MSNKLSRLLLLVVCSCVFGCQQSSSESFKPIPTKTPQTNTKDNLVTQPNSDLDLTGDAKALVNRGVEQGKQENYQEAISLFDKAMEINPDYSRVYYNRAWVKEKIEDLKGALDDYSKVIELNPKNAAPYYTLEKAYQNRGSLHYKLNDYSEAIADADAAIKLNPQAAGIYVNRALANQALENYDLAIADHTKAIELEPRVPKWYFNRGKAYRQAKNYQASINDLNRAIALNPFFNLAYYQRGYSHFKAENYRKAETDYSRALELGYKPAKQVYYWRAKVRIELKKYSGVIADLNRAIAEDSSNPENYQNRATAYHYLRNYKAAYQDAIKAAELYRDQGNEQMYREMLVYAEQIKY